MLKEQAHSDGHAPRGGNGSNGNGQHDHDPPVPQNFGRRATDLLGVARDGEEEHAGVARLLLADDHQMIREGLAGLLDQQADMKVFGQARNGREAVALAAELEPDVILMDIAMPVLNGIEAARQIHAANDKARILALSMHREKRFVTQMLRVGACGYVIKDCSFAELLLAIRSVAAGQVYLSPGITRYVVEDFVHADGDEQATAFDALTPREREVLQLIAEGSITKQIAASLGVSIKTVESHRKQLMQKLNLNSIAGLTKYALRQGVTTFDA